MPSRAGILVSSVGAFIAGFGAPIFLAMLLEAFTSSARRATSLGAGATTLEWTLPSPPPFHQYNELPHILLSIMVDDAWPSPRPVSPRVTTVGDFFALLKPRVMSLVVFTGLAGIVAAPGHVHPLTAVHCAALHRAGGGRERSAQHGL